MPTTTFTCTQCHRELTHTDDLSTGYGCDKDDNKVCFACCAVNDMQSMITDGDSNRLPLYLSGDKPPFRVTNWCGTLGFKVFTYSEGKHRCFSGLTCRTDVWFHGPDGHVWHGIQRGHNNTICRAKRTKEMS